MDESNRVELSVSVAEAVSKCLRKLFIERWNTKFPTKPWNSNGESRNDLIGAIPEKSKKKKRFLQYKDKLHYGNVEDWDITVWGYIMLDSGLNLCDKSVKGDMHKLRTTVVSLSTKASNGSLKSAECDEMISAIKKAVNKICGPDAEDELSGVVQSQIEKFKTNVRQPVIEEIIRPVQEATLNEELPENPSTDINDKPGTSQR